MKKRSALYIRIGCRLTREIVTDIFLSAISRGTNIIYEKFIRLFQEQFSNNNRLFDRLVY